MESGILTLKLKDWLNGILTAICVGVLPIINDAVSNQDLTAIDWGNVLKIALYAGGGYLLRKFFSTNDANGGKFLGKI